MKRPPSTSADQRGATLIEVLVAMLVLSIGLLGLAMKELPLGTAYAIWTGIGAVGTVIAGILLFGESLAPLRLCSVLLIVCGLIGLKLAH